MYGDMNNPVKWTTNRPYKKRTLKETYTYFFKNDSAS